MERDIILENLKTPAEIFRLKEYLRELYFLIDNRFIEVDCQASITVDADQGEIFYSELDTNITGITINNAFQGRVLTFIFKQDGTGSRTVAGWPANVKLEGSSFSVTSNANRYSTLKLQYDGTNWVEIGRTTNVY